MLLGGAAAAWPLAARAQQPERMRRIGVLMHTAADDPESQARVAAFVQGLQEAGWTVGRNVRIDFRWSAGDAARLRKMRRNWSRSPGRHPGRWRRDHVRHCSRRPAPCRSCSRRVVDPVGAGFVESLARPGGNATGFTQFEYG